jgi:hypothetical protein
MTMINRWVTIFDDGDCDIAQDGEIIDIVGAEHFLIQLRNVVEGPTTTRLFSINDLKDAVFFPDEQALDRWRAFVEEREPKIVRLK